MYLPRSKMKSGKYGLKETSKRPIRMLGTKKLSNYNIISSTNYMKHTKEQFQLIAQYDVDSFNEVVMIEGRDDT